MIAYRVYFAQCNGPGGPIKIGRSQDAEKRMRGLRVDCPYPIALVALAPRNMSEKEIIEAFMDSWLHGEWFVESPELRSFIRACTDPSLTADTARERLRRLTPEPPQGAEELHRARLTAQRRRAMAGLRGTHGFTLQQIGDAFGVTRERVRQILGSSSPR